MTGSGKLLLLLQGRKDIKKEEGKEAVHLHPLHPVYFGKCESSVDSILKKKNFRRAMKEENRGDGLSDGHKSAKYNWTSGIACVRGGGGGRKRREAVILSADLHTSPWQWESSSRVNETPTFSPTSVSLPSIFSIKFKNCASDFSLV